jgi:acyl-CoA synthetase (AMP-forming)/AMP-acid ligase II
MAYNIADLFEHAVDAVGERTALVVDDRPISYAELDAAATRFAHHLAAHGVGPGDHVGIYAANSRAWVESMLGAFKARAVPINVNYRYVEDELRYLMDDADLAALVFDRSLAPRVAAVRDGLPRLRHLVHIDDRESGAAAADTAAGGVDATATAAAGDAAGEALEALGSVEHGRALAEANPDRDFGPRSDDDHYILYTGGTTGMPKGVVWRHRDVFMALGGGIDIYTNEPVSSETQLAEKARATATPLVNLCLPPLMHGAAQWSVMRFLFEGGTTVLARRFDPVEAWRQVARWRVNNIMITGDAMGRPLIEALEALDAAGEAPDLSSLLAVASTAVVFSPVVKDRFLARLPNTLLLEAIGSSETGSNGMTTIQPGATAMPRGGPNVRALRDAVVLDDDLRPLPPGSGQIGRLARRGNIPLGYHKDEAKTRATFVTGPDGDRYVLAGDMARLEDDGTITLLGRGSECVNTGGEKVFPEEVEAALKAHPGVFDAVVVGVPDERWGQRVAAVVQAREGHGAPTLADLDTHCRSRLAGYKVPRQLTVVEAIERSPSGKPDYRWAQRVAADAADATATHRTATSG